MYLGDWEEEKIDTSVQNLQKFYNHYHIIKLTNNSNLTYFV
jgi:hypothetical protein